MASDSRSQTNSRTSALDLLRFVAVLLVFFLHYTDSFNDVYSIVPDNHKYSFFSRYGSSGLMIFFMVSGYVVTMTSVDRKLKEFLIIRISRVYPLFWLSCITAFILTRLPFIHNSFLPAVSFKVFLINLTIIPGPLGVQLMNPVFHTLAGEILFYIFLAIIIVFKLWSKILIIITLLLLSWFTVLLDPNIMVIRIIAPFTGGMLFYFINVKYDSSWKLYTLLFVNFICSTVDAKILNDSLNINYPAANHHELWVAITLNTITYLIFFLVATHRLNIKNRPVFQFLGSIAYPFYLFHLYFLQFYWLGRNRIQPDVLLFGILFSILFLSWLMNKYIEKPLYKLSHSLLHRKLIK